MYHSIKHIEIRNEFMLYIAKTYFNHLKLINIGYIESITWGIIIANIVIKIKSKTSFLIFKLELIALILHT